MSLTPVTAADVKAFRSTMGWTQVQLAEAVGGSRRAVESWEAGVRQPPELLRLAFAALAAELEPWSG